MIQLVTIAVLGLAMAGAAIYLAVTLSPWALLAWPGCALMFALTILLEPREHRAPADEVPPCEGCSSPLCPDCTRAS